MRLLDSKGAVILDFTEVESHMYEAERKGEGLFFMRTQAAIKAATVTPEQLFGEWTLLQEIREAALQAHALQRLGRRGSYRITVKPGCDAAIAGLGLATWRLESTSCCSSAAAGPGASRKATPAPGNAFPPSADPMVLMRQ